MLPAKFSIDRPAPGVAVVAVDGELDVYSAPELRDTYVDLICKGRHRLVFDLSRVTRIDSSGLGVIVGALKNLRARDGELALVVPYEAADVQQALSITGLAKTVPAAATVDEARELLEPTPEPQDEHPSFWPPQVGDVWVGRITDPVPLAFTCENLGWLTAIGDWDAEPAYEAFGPLRLLWRHGAVVTAMHSSELSA